MPKSVSKQEYRDPSTGPVFSPRFIISLLLVVLGIAWIVFYYIVVRVDPTSSPRRSPAAPPSSRR